jgi:cytochrome c-type biogenesis protein CcmF
MIAMAVAPFVSWRRDNLKNIAGRFVTMASIALGAVGIFLFVAKNPNWGVGLVGGETVAGFWPRSTLRLDLAIAALLFLCFFVATTNFCRAIELAKRSKLGVGPFISHLGIAVLMAGLIISKSLEKVGDAVVSRDDDGMALGHTFKLTGLDPGKLNDRDNTIKFDVTDPQGKQFEISPNLYYHDGEQVQSWPYIVRTLSHDMYFFLSKPALDVIEQPVQMKPGETKVIFKKDAKNPTDSTITYVDMVKKGQPGTMGAEFGAKLVIQIEGKTYEATPFLKLTERGLVPELTRINNQMQVGLIPPMDAATKAVNVQLFWDPPLFPIHVFYKPLTCLVWIGTGIFTLGGFISAFYRRMKKKSPEGDFVANSAKIDSKN